MMERRNGRSLAQFLCSSVCLFNLCHSWALHSQGLDGCHFPVYSALISARHGYRSLVCFGIESKFFKQSTKLLTFTDHRFALSLRYRIQITGMNQIPQDKRGILFLPNHPAEIDPIILATRLWKSYRPRPVVLETFYHMPLANRI